MNKFIQCALAASLIAAPALSFAEDWKFGIGTGFYALDIDGDTGFDTNLLGSVDFDASLDAGEVRDVMESAFGFGGFAKQGDWTILLSAAQMELEDDVSGNVGATDIDVDVKYTRGKAELAAVYNFAASGDHSFGVLFGLNHTAQEYEVNISGGASLSGTFDDSWTDVIVGVTHSYPISPTMIWTSRADVGSEGRAFIDTGITWVLSKSWTTRLYASATQYDYESGSRGSSDWYKYDATESGVGLSAAYMF